MINIVNLPKFLKSLKYQEFEILDRYLLLKNYIQKHKYILRKHSFNGEKYPAMFARRFRPRKRKIENLTNSVNLEK